VKQSVPSGRTDLRLVLKRRGGVSGVVLDWETRKPIPKFQIRAMLGRKGRPQRVQTVKSFNSKDGFYRLEDLEPGHYNLVVSADKYADSSSDDVTVTRDYEIENVDIYMNKGGNLSGIVVDKKGAPLGGVTVTLNPNKFQDSPLIQIFSAMAGPNNQKKTKRTKTKPDGTFRLSLIVPGTYQVAFSHPNYSPKAVNDIDVILSNDSPMGSIVLTEGASVTGTVRDANGAAVPGAKVVITQENAFMRQDSTDRNGVYSFPHLNPGTYTISVQIDRIQGRSIDNIFKRLMIADKSKKQVFLEEGKKAKADIHLVE
jgi:hypothetical protein